MLNVKLTNGDILIRRFEKADFPKIAPMFMCDETMYYYVTDEVKFNSEQKVRKYIENWDDNESSFMFSCFKDNELIGILTLEDYSKIQKHTECGIALINPRLYGQGLSKKILKLMINYLFNEKRLHKIYIRYIDGSEASYHLFKSLGFQNDGCFREHIRRKDKYLNLNYMSILKKEWLRCSEK